MDIEKLEKLSCLKIDEKQKNVLDKSLGEVLGMMHEIDSMVLSEKINLDNEEKTHFHVLESDTFKKDDLDGGYFLAPKVIKK